MPVKHSIFSEQRILNGVDSARRLARGGRDKAWGKDPVYTFLIKGRFYNVFEHPPNKNSAPGEGAPDPRIVNKRSGKGHRSNYVFGSMLRCFSSLYFYFPDDFIGCYDSTSDRQDMIDDFTLVIQEKYDED